MNIHKKLYNRLIDVVGKDWDKIKDADTFGFLFPELSQEEFDLIGAYKVIEESMYPFTDPFVFENVVDAINANLVDPDETTEPDMDDIMYGVYVISSIRPGIPFGEDIGKYIAARAMVEGLLYVPPPVQWANDYLHIYKEHLPIAKTLSAMSWDDILNYNDKEHPDDSEMLKSQINKLQDILLIYQGKVSQT